MTLPRLHVVTDHAVLARADLADRVAEVAALGPRVAVHVRDRSADGRALHDHARRLAPLVRAGGATLVVNARPDVAAMVQADAVQLGRDDLPPADARRVAPGLRVGRSVHGVGEAREAVAEGADYLLVGTVYPTASHPGEPAAGPGLVRDVAALGTPAVAIGGVRVGHVAELRAAGTWGVAVIRAVWDAADPAAAAGALLAALEAA